MKNGTSITNPILGGDLQNYITTEGGGAGFLGVIIPNLITMLLILGVIVFFFMLVTGSIGWIASGGDKGSIEASRSKITNALVGLVILFSTFAIMLLVETFFGINLTSIDISGLVLQ